ncbi:MAG: GNAT superfamily N-acetyltransferase [Bacteroidia bacterium]|jgi:GNAT superfamily N-acetyltransferase
MTLISRTLIRKGTVEDADSVLMLVRELAAYEKAPNEVTLTLEELKEDGFGRNSIYSLIVAELEGEIVGIALHYEKYSTWKGRSLFLEDIIVTESKRGLGIGHLLFQEVIEVAKEKDSARMEWQVLDWNEPAINFYKKYNAELDGEWLNGKFTREQIQSYKKR